MASFVPDPSAEDHVFVTETNSETAAFAVEDELAQGKSPRAGPVGVAIADPRPARRSARRALKHSQPEPRAPCSSSIDP
jgi:hypothetical protein